MKPRSNPFLRAAALAAVSLALSVIPAAHAATVTWTGADGADWDTGANWSTSAKPLIADTALLNLTGITSVTNATADQTITSISFDTAIASTGTFTLGTTGGNKLTLQNGGIIQILSTLTGTGKTITVNAPLVLAGTSYTFSNANADATNTLNFGGAITSTSGTTILALNGANTGNNTISGNITNGASGTMGVTKSGAGTWILSGAANTYGGTTTVSAGTLAVSGSLTAGGAIVVNGASSSNSTLNITGTLTQTYTAGSVRSFQVGATAGNTGTVNVSGSGILTLAGGMMLGENNGGNGTMNVSGGTVNNNNQIWFAGANSVLNVSGGTFNQSSTTRMGGGNGTTNSTLTVSGTGSYIGGLLDFGIGGAGSTSTVNIGNGSVGGNLSFTGINRNNGTNTINFNGGTLTTSTNITITTAIAATVVKSGGAFFNTTANNLTVDGSLTDGTGGGGLNKSGAGALILSGTVANTFTGTTIVNGGSLVLGKTAGVNAVAGNLTIGDGATTAGLDIVQLTTSNQVADASVVTFNGTGSNAGILRLNNQSETLGGLSSTGGAGIVENESGSAATGILTVSFASGTQTFSGILRNGDGTGTDGTLAFTKTGAGTQALSGSSTYGGTTTVSAGTLSLSGSLTTAGAIRVNGASGAVLDITGNLTQTVGGVRNFQLAVDAGNTGTVNVSGSGILTLGNGMMLGDNGGGNGTMNVSGGTVTTNGDLWFSGATSIVNVSGGTVNASGPTYIGGGNGTTTSTLTVSGSGSYIGGILAFGFGGAGSTSTVNIGNGSVGGNLSLTAISRTNGTNTINFDGGTLTANGVITVPTLVATVVKSGGAFTNVAGANSLTIGGGLTDGTGGGGLTKSGTGTLTLSGTNTYTGATTLNQGTLTLGAGTLATTTGALSVNNTNSAAAGTAAILNLSTAADTTTGSLSGSISTPLSGTNTATINTQSSRTLTVNQTANGTYAGVIAGAGNFALGGLSTNTLTLSGINTYSGTTTISAGKLLYTRTNSTSDYAGSGGYSIAAGATLEVNASAGARFNTSNNQFTGAGTFIKSGSGRTFLTAGTKTQSFNMSAGGLIDVQAGILDTSAQATNLASLNIANGATLLIAHTDAITTLQFDALTGNGALSMTGAGSRTVVVGANDAAAGIYNAAGSATFSGVITNSGTISLTKTGAGTQILSGANTYTGQTTISTGALQIGAGGTTGKLSASSAIVNNANLTINRSDTVIQGTDFSSAAITGTGSLTAAGTGTTTLNAANAYSGATTVNAGADLRINGAQTGGGTVTVAATGKLGGSGSVIGGINVSGILAPGNSIESLGSGSLSFSAGSTYAYEFSTLGLNGDLAYSSGTLGIASGTILTLTDLGDSTALANGSKLTLISSVGSWNGGLFTYGGSPLADDSEITLGANTWRFNYNDTVAGSNFTDDITGATNYITLTAVPEPNVAALIGGLGTLLLLRRRR